MSQYFFTLPNNLVFYFRQFVQQKNITPCCLVREVKMLKKRKKKKKEIFVEFQKNSEMINVKKMPTSRKAVELDNFIL